MPTSNHDIDDIKLNIRAIFKKFDVIAKQDREDSKEIRDKHEDMIKFIYDLKEPMIKRDSQVGQNERDVISLEGRVEKLESTNSARYKYERNEAKTGLKNLIGKNWKIAFGFISFIIYEICKMMIGGLQ